MHRATHQLANLKQKVEESQQRLQETTVLLSSTQILKERVQAKKTSVETAKSRTVNKSAMKDLIEIQTVVKQTTDSKRKVEQAYHQMATKHEQHQIQNAMTKSF